MMEMIRRTLNRITSETGQALTEYSLILVFVAAVCVFALAFLGTALDGWYRSAGAQIASLV